MESSLIEKYLLTEINDLYIAVRRATHIGYRDLYNREEAKYKRSPEYTKAKNKEYWKKSKKERNQEAIEQELAKLDYWSPRRGPSAGKHISYSKKVDEDSSSDYVFPIGFEPSITEYEYFQNEAEKIKALTKDSLFLSVADSLSHHCIEWNQYATFYCHRGFDIKSYLSYVKINDDYLLIFSKMLIDIYKAFNISIPNAWCSNERTIVTNGCKIEATILENGKSTTLNVNVAESPTQIILLGKTVGESFTFDNIPLTYSINRILH